MTSWVAVDFETANEFRGSPCAVALVEVHDDTVARQWSTLIQPPPSASYFSPFCVSLHGITEDRVRDAPTWPEALAEIVGFVDGRVLVAHNAAFDLGVIRDACNESGNTWPYLRYACSLVVARRTWNLLSYSLPWVAEAAGHHLTDHHEPGADALAAAQVMIAAKRSHAAADLHDLLSLLRVGLGQVSDGTWNGCRYAGDIRARAAMPGANPNADPHGPFFGLTVCFTGTLASMTRRDAWHLIAEAGGQPVNGVSNATDVLVVGTQDHRRLRPGDAMSAKHRKAAQLLDRSHQIEVISEADYLERLASTEGLRLDRM